MRMIVGNSDMGKKTIKNLRLRNGFEYFKMSDLSIDELDAVIRELGKYSLPPRCEFHAWDGLKSNTISCDFMDFGKFLSYGVIQEIKFLDINLSNRRNKKYVDLKVTVSYGEAVQGYVFLKHFTLKSIRRDIASQSLRSLGYKIDVVRPKKTGDKNEKRLGIS